MKVKIKKSKLIEDISPFYQYQIQYNNYVITVVYVPFLKEYYFDLFNAEYTTKDFMEVLGIIKDNC